MTTPSHFARFTHRRTWDIAMQRQPSMQGHMFACELIARLDCPRPPPAPAAQPARYRITTHDPRQR